MSEAEKEEMEVRKLRAEGTPCTRENFLVWRKKFEKEMLEKAAEEAALAETEKGNKKEKIVDKSGRISGFDQFNGMAGVLNMEAIEAAADAAEEDEDEINVEELDVDEELFDDEDDVDLDDLDFDSDEDDDESDEDEPDI